MLYFCLFLGFVLIIDTLFAINMSNINLGVLLPAFLGIPLVYYSYLLAFAPQILALPIVRICVSLIEIGYLLILIMLICCICCTAIYTRRCKSIQADAVIVLGAGLRKQRPSRLLRMRLNMAIEAAHDRDLPILVTGGKGKQEQISEAKAMQRYLMEQGIPEKRILVENRARNTYENIKFSYAILMERFSFQPKVIIVTSDFHCFRTAQIAKKFFKEYALKQARSAWYMKPNFYLREMLSIANYYLRELFQK